MALEAEKSINVFEGLLDKVKHNEEKVVEIVTFAQDGVSGFKRIYSCIGILDENLLNDALNKFVQKLVPEGESRKTLEAAFDNEPDRVKHFSHNDEATSEWTTLFDNITIGIKAIRDQRGESIRTWYIKSTQL